MEIVTSWMEEGLQQGRREGLDRERRLIQRLLCKQLGNLVPAAETQIANLSADQIEQLGEALFDFASPADLNAWLDTHR